MIRYCSHGTEGSGSARYDEGDVAPKDMSRASVWLIDNGRGCEGLRHYLMGVLTVLSCFLDGIGMWLMLTVLL